MTLAYWVSAIAAFALSFLPVGVYIAPLFLYLMLAITVLLIPAQLAWNPGSFGEVMARCLYTIVYSIVVYARLYQAGELSVSGAHVNPDFLTALYFSGTTWTTVGYGDVSPVENLRMLTTVEAINGYFAMAVFMAIVAIWVNAELRKSETYMKALDNPAIEKAMAEAVPELLQKMRDRE